MKKLLISAGTALVLMAGPLQASTDYALIAEAVELLIGKYQSQEQKITDLESRLSSPDSEKDALQARVKALESRLETLCDDCPHMDTIEASLKTMSQDADDLRAELDNAKRRIAILEKKMALDEEAKVGDMSARLQKQAERLKSFVDEPKSASMDDDEEVRDEYGVIHSDRPSLK